MSDQITGLGALPFSQSDANLIDFITRQVVNGMATVTLVQVKAVYADTVDVQPMVAQLDGAGNAIPHGIIHDLPFFKLRAGAVEIRAVPVVGDIGMASFCHNDTSSVRATKAPAAPPTRRRFDWGDGLYLGGFLGPAATAWIDVTPEQIEVKAPTIKLTADTLESVGAWTHDGSMDVTGDITSDGEVTASSKALSTHTHGGVTAGAGTSGPPT